MNRTVEATGYIVLLLLGAALCVLGIANIRGDISSVKAYLRLAVPEENLPKYSKRMGIGTLIAGLSAAGAAAAQMLHETEFVSWLLAAGVLLGFGLMVFALLSGTGLLQRIQVFWRAWREKRSSRA